VVRPLVTAASQTSAGSTPCWIKKIFEPNRAPSCVASPFVTTPEANVPVVRVVRIPRITRTLGTFSYYMMTISEYLRILGCVWLQNGVAVAGGFKHEVAAFR